MKSKMGKRIDKGKIKALLKKRKITYEEIGKRIGFTSGSAISKAIDAGVFSGVIVNGLSTYFGIRPEEYEYIPPVTESAISVEQDATLEIPLEESTLYVTMKTAILDALKEWWGGV